MDNDLTGKYVNKREALEILASMNVHWTQRQIDWTAEPDVDGNRKWPWFRDDKGSLRIDEGFIRAQFHNRQMKALQKWQNNAHRL